MHIKREDYHGGSFNDNDFRKLLKNVEILEEIAPSQSLKIKGSIEVFKTFDEVVASCYGKRCYTKLKISIMHKVHAVFFHVSEFCGLKEMGLSPCSEQASESVHYDFKQKWQTFKIRDTNHPEYGKRLLEAIVCMYLYTCIYTYIHLYTLIYTLYIYLYTCIVCMYLYVCMHL